MYVSLIVIRSKRAYLTQKSINWKGVKRWRCDDELDDVTKQPAARSKVRYSVYIIIHGNTVC